MVRTGRLAILVAAACGGFMLVLGCDMQQQDAVKTAAAQATVPAAPAWKAGGLYAIPHEDGGFGVVKILVLEPGIVHVRLYSNRLDHHPRMIDEASLELKAVDLKSKNAGDVGIGHLPLREAAFQSWGPVFVQQSRVEESELDGYAMWKEAGGGVW